MFDCLIGRRPRRSASLPQGLRGDKAGGPRSCAAVMGRADAQERVPPADAQERVPPACGNLNAPTRAFGRATPRMVIQFEGTSTTIRRDMAWSACNSSFNCWQFLMPRLAMNTNAGVLASIIAPMMFSLQRRVLTSSQ